MKDLYLAICRRGEKEELALPGSESRAEMDLKNKKNPISFPSYHIRLSNSALCKAVSGAGTCTWWINQQIKKKKCAGTVGRFLPVRLGKVWANAVRSRRSRFLHRRNGIKRKNRRFCDFTPKKAQLIQTDPSF